MFESSVEAGMIGEIETSLDAERSRCKGQLKCFLYRYYTQS